MMDNRVVEDQSQEVCVDLRSTGNWGGDSRLFDTEYDSEDEDESAGKQEIVLTYDHM